MFRHEVDKVHLPEALAASATIGRAFIPSWNEVLNSVAPHSAVVILATWSVAQLRAYAKLRSQTKL